MSDSDLEKVPLTNWFDSESNLPEISVNSTIELGVNVSSPFANPIHVQVLGAEDSISAPNKGNPVGHALLEETESYEGVNLIDNLIQTPPQSKSTLPFSCHCGWDMGRGRGMRREGVKSSTVILRCSYYCNTWM